MLIDEIKKRMFVAMKEKKTLEKEILRTVIGEVTSTGADPDDARVLLVLRKLVKSNEETLGVATDATMRTNLEQELLVLREYLPRTLDVERIVEELAAVADAVRAAGNDGQAVGVAMKHLKAADLLVEGKDVAQAVKRLRG